MGTSITDAQLGVWNATAMEFPRDLCVPQLVGKQAAARQDAVALVADDETLTYLELDSRANQVAHYIHTLGAGPDVLVGLCVERPISMVVGALGILKAGAAYVPLDPGYPAERLAFVLNDAQTQVLVTEQRVLERLPGGATHIVALDTQRSEIARESSHAPAIEVSPRDLAYVIYTSGSTGQPKGVQITHESLLNLVFWHQRAFGVTSADSATQLASPSFDAAVWELWPYLTAGARVYLPDKYTKLAPEALRDWLVRHGITISFLATALAESVMRLDWPPETALRVLLTGADTLQRYSPPTLPFMLVNNYGPTECTVVATSGRVVADAQRTTRPSIGRPIANTQVYILDDSLQPVPEGLIGELYIGGVGLARGYLNRPELTAERFIRNPFSAAPGARLYRTGDRGYFLSDGQIAFVGRTDEQIKIRGYRIEPGEIVAALNCHPAVQTSIVVAREDIPDEKRLVAYVVPAAGPRPTPAALHEFLATKLPDYMVPVVFEFMEALPLTPNGKVDRSALPAPTAAYRIRSASFTGPRTPIEEGLATIVATLMGLDQVSIYDNFFLLGGHSLLGAQIIARVHEAFGVDLPLHSLFNTPTVAQLAAEIEGLILAMVVAMDDDEVHVRLGTRTPG
jgi:amino acid adenylation domain-containing protein